MIARIWPPSRTGRLVLSLVFLVTTLYGPASGAFRIIQEGMTVPEIKGKDLLSGDRVSWNPGEGGGTQSAILVAFWATWSPRSLMLLEDLREMAVKHRDLDLRIIAVNVDGQHVDPGVLEQIVAVARDLDLPFPVMLDEKLELFQAYGVIAVPSVALVDGTGVLRYGPAGYSFVVRDGLVDSTEVLLGLRQSDTVAALEPGHLPNPQADRYCNLGRALVVKGLYKQALENIDRSIAADTLFSSPLTLQGQIHLVLGEFEAAARSFAHAVELDTTSVVARAGWGRACLGLGKVNEAEAHFVAAKALDEFYTPALVGLAECHMGNGRFDVAWPLFAAALELNPRDPELLLCLGRYFRETGDLGSSVAALRSAIELMVTLPVLRPELGH